MLNESFVASTLNPEKPSNSVLAGIHLHEFQPLPALKHTFKKSSAHPNCVAVSLTHIFAAQADKAVVHVYSRERNNQEATIPFPERIHSIVLAGGLDGTGTGTLILGTECGRIILWELATGRQVSSPQHHLQPVTCLAVDPKGNILLSGSADSVVQVWSITQLLSFTASRDLDGSRESPFSPIRSLSNHRAAITSLVFGHSHSINNIAVSASNDNTCVVWDYLRGRVLHTFLLLKQPLCLDLDPIDRAVYAGYDDGSIQVMNFYGHGGLIAPLRQHTSQSTPTLPPPSDRWMPMDHSGSPVLCIQVSYDGTTLLSGHQDGKIHTWDVAMGRYRKQLADFAAPITNIRILTPTGFINTKESLNTLQNVVKPRYESSTNVTYGHPRHMVPVGLNWTVQFNTPLKKSKTLERQAMTESGWPDELLKEYIADMKAERDAAKTAPDLEILTELRAEKDSWKAQLEQVVEREKRAKKEIQEFKQQDWRRQKMEEVKAARKKRKRVRRLKQAEIDRKQAMGEKPAPEEDEEMLIDNKDKEDLSSSTDEMTDS